MRHRLRANTGSWARGLGQPLPHSLRRKQPADSSLWNRKNKAVCAATRCVAVCGAQYGHFQLTRVFILSFLSPENSQYILFNPRGLG